MQTVFASHWIEFGPKMENLVGADGKSIFINFQVKNTNCTLYTYYMRKYGAYSPVVLSLIIFWCRENQKPVFQ